MNYRSEIARKAIHLSATLAPIIYLLTNRTFMLVVGIPLMVFFLVIDLLRQQYPPFRALYGRWLGYMMRDHEQRTLCGASYVMIAVVLCVWLFPQRVAVAALFMMTISDALASLVGRRAGGPRWFGKTLAGSLAFLISAGIIARLSLPAEPWAGGAGALVATIVEALPLRLGGLVLDDNLIVPLAGGAVMTLLIGHI